MGSTTKAVDYKTNKSNGNAVINTSFSNKPNIIVPSLSSANSATYTRAVTTGLVTVINGGSSPIAHNIPATENGNSIILLGNTGTLSATAKVYTNFLWISATSFSCRDTVKTATSGTLKTNNAVTLAATLTIPGGSIGSLGTLNGWLIEHNNDSVGVKNVYVDIGSSLNIIASLSAQNSIVSSHLHFNELHNKTASSQFVGVGTNNTLAVNTTIDQPLSIRVQCVAANDYVAIDSYVVNIQKIG